MKRCTAKINSSKQAVVSLPKESNSKILDDSFKTAERILRWLENPPDKNDDIKQQYKELIDKMNQMEHLEAIPSGALKKEIFYLRHQHVTNESTMTKLRVMFDASAKSCSGLSINDIPVIGPANQNNLFSILLGFRLHRIALIAYIAKRFRQVGSNDDDRNLH